MANYLEICQEVAKLSGTIGDSLPASVVSQTGRLGLIVTLVKNAWVKIQNARSEWKWARFEYTEKSLVVGQKDYTGISLGLTDHQSWIVDETTPVFCYRVDEGLSQQYRLKPLVWEDFRNLYMIGDVANGRPEHVSVRPRDGALMIGPAPDVAYKISGEYVPDVQELAANTDIPRMPTQYHNVIVYHALMDLALYDEAVAAYQSASAVYGPLWHALISDQIPSIAINWAYKP